MFSRLPLLSEEDEPDLWLGGAIFLLLDDPECWVHRRVESVSFLDASSVRRRMSVDFDVPSEGAKPTEGPALVPLTLLEKRPLVDLDVQDESGAACSILNADENAFVAWSLLARVAQVVLADPQDPDPDVPVQILEDLKVIAGAPREEALAVLQAITEGDEADLRQRLSLPLFQEYAMWLATKFLLLVEIPPTSPIRRVLKFSYTQPLERVETARLQRFLSMVGWRPAQFDVAVQGIGEGQTYHCEFLAPPGLEVTRAELVAFDPEQADAAVLERDGEIVGPRAHIYAPDAPLGADGVASVWLHAPRSGLLRASLLTSAAIAAVFLFFLVGDRIAQVRESLTLPLLLVVPGVVAGLTLRAGEHRVATDLLAGIRGAVVIAALAAYSGALMIGAGAAHSTVVAMWKVLGIVTLLCFTSLSVAYCFGTRRAV